MRTSYLPPEVWKWNTDHVTPLPETPQEFPICCTNGQVLTRGCKLLEPRPLTCAGLPHFSLPYWPAGAPGTLQAGSFPGLTAFLPLPLPLTPAALAPHFLQVFTHNAACSVRLTYWLYLEPEHLSGSLVFSPQYLPYSTVITIYFNSLCSLSWLLSLE